MYRNPVKKFKEVPKEDMMTTKQLEAFNTLSDVHKQVFLQSVPEYRKIVIVYS